MAARTKMRKRSQLHDLETVAQFVLTVGLLAWAASFYSRSTRPVNGWLSFSKSSVERCTVPQLKLRGFMCFW